MRKNLLLTMVMLGAVSTALTAAPGRGRGHEDRPDGPPGRGRGRAEERRPPAPPPPPPAREVRREIHHEFRPGDRELIARYYQDPKHGPRRLPPGLAARMERGRPLPPGWRKRFRPFPVVLERQLPPVPAGCARGLVDGYAITYSRRTGLVIDVFAAFGQ
jgi:hypothetical protein